MEYSGSDQVINVFDGAVSTRVLKQAGRSFAFEVTLDLVKGVSFFAQKPPLHFHVNQHEYIQASQGITGLEVDGREIVLKPGSPEYRIDSWAHHRSYPIPSSSGEGSDKVVFLLSGAESPEPFQLNLLFFENWYRYQESVVTSGKNIDFIQVLSTFDGGGTYVSLPSWVPFNQRVSQIMGIVVGRWLGGLLGYQPFYREWSTDWGLACHQMRTSIFQRRFATSTKSD